MGAKEQLLDFKKKLDPQIEQFFDEYLRDTKDLSEEAKFAVEVIKDYTVRGGKRLRGSFVYYSYLLLGGKNKDEIMKAAILVEIIHTYLLIEDDFMDKSLVRRKKPTAHIICEEYLNGKYEDEDIAHLGVSVAIMAATVACHLSLRCLSDLNFRPEYKETVMSAVNDRLMYTGLGQIHDIISVVKPDFTEDEAMLVHKWKTATYTYELPIFSGAIFAGASEKDLQSLSAYAIPAGIAFQIQDDILDIYSDEEKLGKPIGTDITEGKRTILILKALENGTKPQKDFINNILGKPNLSNADINRIREIIKDTGSYEYAKDLAQKYVEEALHATKKMKSWNEEGRDFLEGIAQYMIEREL